MKKILKTIYRVFACSMAALFSLVCLTAVIFLVADATAYRSARTLPSYEKQDIGVILGKEVWTDEDYRTLYLQTGLGKSALDKLKGKDERILAFQEALFYEGEFTEEEVAFTTKHETMCDDYRAPLVELEDGDVLVTSACHTFGWRNGHSAIVVDAVAQCVLESRSLGIPSDVGTVTWFRECPNFLVLRLKDKTKEERAEIAAWASENLVGIDYSIVVGIFSPKDQGDTPSVTHCSRLVWQAYYHFGYDIDSDGGSVVTSRDIANSDCFEVVQVYGFDPLTLW